MPAPLFDTAGSIISPSLRFERQLPAAPMSPGSLRCRCAMSRHSVSGVRRPLRWRSTWADWDCRWRTPRPPLFLLCSWPASAILMRHARQLRPLSAESLLKARGRSPAALLLSLVDAQSSRLLDAGRVVDGGHLAVLEADRHRGVTVWWVNRDPRAIWQRDDKVEDLTRFLLGTQL